MSKKTKYMLGGIVAIALSYISARMGVEVSHAVLVAWHVMFSVATGFGGLAAIMITSVEM
jgi:hypothetical protein